MQHARAFGQTNRERPVPVADPSKRWEYLQHQNQQQQQRLLSKVPRGSRVFQRNRNLEETVRQREEEAQRRRMEQEEAQRPSAARLTRSFGAGRAPAAISGRAPKPAPGRAFGATRERNQAQQQALAMEFDTPYQWEQPEQPEEPEQDEFGQLQ